MLTSISRYFQSNNEYWYKNIKSTIVLWTVWPRILLPQTQWPRTSNYRIYALNSLRCQITQLTRNMYIFEETVSYFTQYVKKLRENFPVWEYKSLVIKSWAKEYWALEFIPRKTLLIEKISCKNIFSFYLLDFELNNRIMISYINQTLEKFDRIMIIHWWCIFIIIRIVHIL